MFKKNVSRFQEQKEQKEKEEEKEVSIECEESSEHRIINVYGDIDEEKSSDVVYSLLSLNSSGERIVTIEEKEEEPVQKLFYQPIEMYLSTYGGSASDMFAIYDTIRMIESEVYTIGIGKVMSAGVLLLAAGEKGHRKIGKNCRVMIHSVMGGSHGSLHNIENEMAEIRWVQEQYVGCLVKETSMSKRQLKSMLKRKINVYLSAEEAVKYGIADEII